MDFAILIEPTVQKTLNRQLNQVVKVHSHPILKREREN